MIFELAGDFGAALAAMPEDHPRHQILQLLEEAIRRDIHFIARHPTTLFQCLWNTCWWYDCPEARGEGEGEQGRETEAASAGMNCPGFRELLESWCSNRQGCPYWLRASAPLPGHGGNVREIAHFTNPSSIQAFCARRGLLAVAAPSGAAETYAVPPGISLFSRDLNGGRVAAVAMSPTSSVLAFRDAEGVIRMEGCSATLQGRRGETPLLFRSNGSVVAVNEKNELVAWFPAEGRCESLAENVPFPLRVLKDCGEGSGPFFVAGAREQQIGIVASAESTRQTRIVQHLGPEIIDADIRSAMGRVVLLLKNRSIRVTDPSMTNLIAEVFYQREHPRLAGAPLRAVLSGENVCFVTSYGRVGRWNWRTSKLDHVANCYEKTEHRPIALFDVLGGEAGLLMSFPTHAIALDVGHSSEATVRHDGRPTQCILPRGHATLVGVSEDENMIRWFSLGLALLGKYSWPRPTCAAYIETTRETVAGNRSGFVLHHPFPGTGGSVREYRVSSRPIVGIVSRRGQGCVAVDASGERFELARPQPTGGSTTRPVSFRTQLRAFSNSNSDGMFSLYESGNNWTFAYQDEGNEEGIVATSRRRIWDAAVSPSGQRACIAGDELAVYERRHATWTELARSQERARLTAFVGDEFIAVVLMERRSCVEIRRAIDFAQVATIDLGHRALCMGTNERLLAVGLESGHLVSMSLRGSVQAVINHER